MAKTKTIMDMTPQELLKMFVEDVGVLIDARIRTAEINIKANTDAAIKASEERIKQELRAELASKKDLQAVEERLTKKIETVEQKLDKTAEDHEQRIEQLEENQVSTHKN